LVREAAAGALAIACWRNLFAAGVLLPVVGGRRALRVEVGQTTIRERRLVVASGALLAAHFATWVPSLSFTTVASSTALVCTQPVWAALIGRWRGEPAGRRTGAGIAVALVGVLLLTGVDLSVSGRALYGDLLALVGGVLAAAYTSVGAEVRRTVSTTVYTAGSYTVAAVLLAAAAAAGGQALGGYDARTWWVLIALTVGPQFLGHSLFNRVVAVLGATVVSVVILLEAVGSPLIAWWWQGETPPVAALPAAALLLGGVALVVTDPRRRLAPDLAEPPPAT
jgi:drug/metabolite transporter (DMT)-like permease